jgi:hypothetical protein
VVVSLSSCCDKCIVSLRITSPLPWCDIVLSLCPCFGRIWFWSACLSVTCMSVICLSVACLSVACLSVACLSVACLSVACLSVACLSVACLSVTCLSATFTVDAFTSFPSSLFAAFLSFLLVVVSRHVFLISGIDLLIFSLVLLISSINRASSCCVLHSVDFNRSSTSLQYARKEASVLILPSSAHI